MQLGGNMSKRVYVIVDGGLVDRVEVPQETDGSSTVIDWDNIKVDPEREWKQFDDQDRAYIRANFPDEYVDYFADLDK
jgi:hypothetical protein